MGIMRSRTVAANTCLSCMPIAYSTLWAAQTVSTKLYMAMQQRQPIRILAAVAAAELTKLAAAGFVLGFHTRPLKPRLLVCALCSVACAALAYPALARIAVTHYVPLLGCQHITRLMFTTAADGIEVCTPRALQAACLGMAAFLVAASNTDRWAVVAIFVQSFLVCFAEALDDVDDAEGDLFSATMCTAWTSTMLVLGSALADVRNTALTIASPTHPYALSTIALMSISGLVRSAASSQQPWPATAAVLESTMLFAAGSTMLAEAITFRAVAANTLAVVAAGMSL